MIETHERKRSGVYRMRQQGGPIATRGLVFGMVSLVRAFIVRDGNFGGGPVLKRDVCWFWIVFWVFERTMDDRCKI